MIHFSTKEENERLEVTFEGDLDIDSTEVIGEQLLPLMGKYKSVLINFEQVPFVDSSGIGLLLDMVQTLGEAGTDVTISHVQKDVQDVFELLQIPDILGEGVVI
ncbi:STAS domain-containing protein [Bacillus sp. KH172YL63]|uniref:STAS domain-containing protein n=1 Tax=Bacillus sp. KH172YL63 TaxID=2709784 RepID=UPI0013E47A6A|nr:STAS domain-containing protein [Bacillus sp. KH172YL63]BCB05710.1 anti-sigma F factor antagonist [Bacillus sp. KH172YL63]